MVKRVFPFFSGFKQRAPFYFTLVISKAILVCLGVTKSKLFEFISTLIEMLPDSHKVTNICSRLDRSVCLKQASAKQHQHVFGQCLSFSLPVGLIFILAKFGRWEQHDLFSTVSIAAYSESYFLFFIPQNPFSATMSFIKLAVVLFICKPFLSTAVINRGESVSVATIISI